MKSRRSLLNFVMCLLTLLCVAWMAPSATAADTEPEQEKTAKILSKDERFIDNGDKTITDTHTDIMWTKMDSYLHTGHWLSLEDAVLYIETLNKIGYANHYDWQMPTLDNLFSLYESEKINSKQIGREMVIHMDPIFAKEGVGALWSSDRNGAFNGRGIVFNNGAKFSAPKKSRARKGVRAMRYTKP